MKKPLVVILALIAIACIASVFYLLFSNDNLGSALLSVILPAAVALICGALIGKITSPEDAVAHDINLGQKI